MGDNKGTTRSNAPATSRIKSIVNQAPFFCKVIELILCVVTIGLIVDPLKSSEMRMNLDQAGNVYVSICGYILINSIIILCYLIGEHQPKRMSMIFSSVGGILSFASGVVLTHNWSKLNGNLIHQYHEQYSNQMIASGIFAFIASAVFVTDVILTNKYK